MAAINISGVPGSAGRMLPINPASITSNVRLKPTICSVVMREVYHTRLQMQKFKGACAAN